MPRTGVTTYDLLISCPGDVVEEISIIRDVVDNFNKMYGTLNNIQVLTHHWSTDSYPQSGGKPQDLLNKQFINDCDAAVAVFWTRFGTPTDNYQSGTEEEIEEMIKNGKQVFLYFSSKLIDPSVINIEQYGKIQIFKEKYKDKGIYWTYSDINEFNRLLLNHISKHFLGILTSSETTVVERSQLTVRGVIENKPSEFLHIVKGKWMESKLFKNKEEKIEELFEKITSIVLPEVEIKPKGEIMNPNDRLIAKLSGQLNDNKVPVTIIDEIKDCIVGYSDMHDITLSKSFFYLASLKKPMVSINTNMFGSTAPSLIGTEEEKEKYNSIKDLYWKINEYNEYTEFFTNLQSIWFIKCIVSNNGKSYDEDIDVHLKIPKGHIFKFSELPVPGHSFINDFNKHYIADLLFTMKKTVSIDAYSNYPLFSVSPLKDIPDLIFNRKSVEQIYSEEKSLYKRKIKNIFCYNFFETEDYDVLSFNIPYLKQNTNITTPSLLLFKSNPSKIEYEIRAKHSPDVVCGEIEVKDALD